MRRQAERAGELRAAIDRLPVTTRRAMLEGIETSPIVVGADGDPRGGVCPVYAISSPPSKRIGRPFARAWDRYAGARLPRPARERELRTLRSMLETSIELEADPAASLNAAIAEHRASQERSHAIEEQRASQERSHAIEERSRAIEEQRAARQRATAAPRQADTGERDRTDELSQRHGWAWLRPFRRYDEYERALQALEEMEREAGPNSEREVGPGSERERLDSEREQLVLSSSERG